ncbi:MAG: type I methionyl aminopeptidase [Myxococcales bacterium]|nr:MAG: type I methionyl aminopeptidase [Myxococcales bacterium]
MSESMLQQLREACKLAARTLVMVGEHIRPGISTGDINTLGHDFTIEHGARPSPLNYKGYPKSVCTSVNEVVCHGIPSGYKLKDGDIINVDVTSYFPTEHGFHGDTSAMYYVGEPSDGAKKVVEVARRCLELGIEQAKPSARIGDIGAAIQNYAEAQGCSVVRDFVGHGIGRQFHMPPQIPHHGKAGTGKRLKAGMVFTIEPMINLGGYECEILSDGWTAVTTDGSLSAQFEHTLAITKDGCEVLTARDALIPNSEDKPWADLGPRSVPASKNARIS